MQPKCYRHDITGERELSMGKWGKAARLSGLVTGLVMQLHQLGGPKGQRGISAPAIVAELNLVYVRGEPFHDCADLPPTQPVRGKVLQQRNHG